MTPSRIFATSYLVLALAACADPNGALPPWQPGSGPPSPAGSTGSAGIAAPAAGSGAPIADPMSLPSARPMSLEGDPIYSRFVRLGNEQWQRSVVDILGLDQPSDASRGFERPVAGTTDFANNEHVLTVSNGLWQSYQLAAEQAADLVTGSSQRLTSLYPGTDPAGFIRKLGRRAFRRPLTAAEEQSYSTLFARGASGGAFAGGAGLVIRALLQSPSFLYRSELGDDAAPLSGYELAAKLSFWLLGTTPSDGLLDAAGAGQLDTPDGAVAIARQMLAQPIAAETMRSFHRELLHFDLYTTLTKIGVAGYSEALNHELEDASYRFFDRIYADQQGLREILTSSRGFVGPGMAAIYGVAPPPSGLEERELGPTRLGYFSQLPFLALYAFNEQPDPIHRGVTLNLDLLCADPGKPVAQLPPIPALKPGQTNREMISTLTEGCGRQCHTFYINPLGFAFEGFDGMGRLRSLDNGRPVDSAASYPFAEGVAGFAGAAELMQLMASSKQAHACYAKKIASHALQRDIVPSDLPLLETLSGVSRLGGSIQQVMLTLVQDPAFRLRHGATL